MFPKTHEKTQAKIPKKPQKPETLVELNWRKIVQKKPAIKHCFSIKLYQYRCPPLLSV